MNHISIALLNELETLATEIQAYDMTHTSETARMSEPAEVTAKRNRASEICFELGAIV